MIDVKRDVVKVKEIHKYIVLIVLAIITFIIGVVLETPAGNLLAIRKRAETDYRNAFKC